MRPITGTVPAARICTASSFPENGDEFSPCCIPPGEREPIPPLFCFTAFPAASGTLDLYTPPQLHGGPLAQAVRRAGGTLFREVTYPTDHFFADYRLAVAGTVTEFLKGQLPQ